MTKPGPDGSIPGRGGLSGQPGRLPHGIHMPRCARCTIWLAIAVVSVTAGCCRGPASLAAQHNVPRERRWCVAKLPRLMIAAWSRPDGVAQVHDSAAEALLVQQPQLHAARQGRACRRRPSRGAGAAASTRPVRRASAPSSAPPTLRSRSDDDSEYPNDGLQTRTRPIRDTQTIRGGISERPASMT